MLIMYLEMKKSTDLMGALIHVVRQEQIQICTIYELLPTFPSTKLLDRCPLDLFWLSDIPGTVRMFQTCCRFADLIAPQFGISGLGLQQIILFSSFGTIAELGFNSMANWKWY